jgi:DNA polymerase-3 subunit delta'
MQSIEILKQSIEKNKLGHALLLQGSDVSILSNAAEELSALILKCRSIFEHPDFFTLRPSGKSRYIKIGSKEERHKGAWAENTMRRLINDLQKTAHQGGKKVAIIYEADRMNIEAANAFLKTLEEPPPDTHLFLLSTNPYRLLDTIKSRCLSYRIQDKSRFQELETWDQWKQTYWEWMGSLIQGYERTKLCTLFFGFYGMILKLQKTIEAYRNLVWEEEKNKITRNLSEDEKTAMEIGIERSIREQLFTEIAELTTRFVDQTANENESKYLIKPLEDCINALEKSSGLLKLNYNVSNAIELYFLQSLRIWTQASKQID